MANRSKSTRPHPVEKTVGDCLETPLPIFLFILLRRQSLRDGIASTYLGALLTSDLGSTVVGFIATENFKFTL